jgi:hypothetical protein
VLNIEYSGIFGFGGSSVARRETTTREEMLWRQKVKKRM